MNTSTPIAKKRFAIYHLGMKKFLFMLRETPHGSPFTWMPSNGIFFTLNQENISSFIGYLHNDKYSKIGTVCIWVINFLRRENSWKDIMVVPLDLLEVGSDEVNLYAPDYDRSYQLWLGK